MPNLVKRRKLYGRFLFILQLYFMRITNLFRKKSQHALSLEESNILTIEANKKIIFDTCSWTIKKIIEYNWGELLVSYDYILDNGSELKYLGVEQNGNNLLLSIKKDINIELIDSNVKSEIISNEVPPRILHFNGIQFLFDRESIGKSRLEHSSDWTNLTVWEYIDKSKKNVLTIEQYSDKEIFSSVGTIISINEISLD